MIKKYDGFSATKTSTGREILPAGGYVCEIKSSKQEVYSWGSRLVLMIEVAEGEYKDFFSKDYRSQDREDKFWRGIINQNVPNESADNYENQKRFFRSFTNAVEASNPGYHWDWNETGLKGKKIGVVFGEREKQSQKGTVYTITNAEKIISVEDVRSGNFKIPEKKCLVPTGNTFGGFTAITPDSDDLPF